MEVILLGVVMFTVVVCALVVVLMIAKARLVSSEEITVNVNDNPELSFKAPAGSTLLDTLATDVLLNGYQLPYDKIGLFMDILEKVAAQQEAMAVDANQIDEEGFAIFDRSSFLSSE